MIANWVKKRAKYLLRGIRDLLDDVVPVDVMAADKARLQQMPTTAQTILLNPMLEKQRYDARLKAPVPMPPHASVSAGDDAATYEQPVLRDNITLADVMGHPLVQPFRHATSLGKPTRNPSYLPSSVFARTMVDLLTPGSTEPSLADIEAGDGQCRIRPSCSNRSAACSRLPRANSTRSWAACKPSSTGRWTVSPVPTSDGPNVG
jgi:hypothetical protein